MSRNLMSDDQDVAFNVVAMHHCSWRMLQQYSSFLHRYANVSGLSIDSSRIIKRRRNQVWQLQGDLMAAKALSAPDRRVQGIQTNPKQKYTCMQFDSQWCMLNKLCCILSDGHDFKLAKGTHCCQGGYSYANLYSTNDMLKKRPVAKHIAYCPCILSLPVDLPLALNSKYQSLVL